jgi:hypothetical protein
VRPLLLATVPLALSGMVVSPPARAAKPPATSSTPATAPPPPAPPPVPAMPAPTGAGPRAEKAVVVPIRIEIPLSVIMPPTEAKPDADSDYTTDRYEPAGFPLLGGDSDIGFQFGAVATLSHFADGIKPYSWNMDLVASASLKDGPKGIQVVQESFLYNADLPGYLGGKLRLNPQVQYQRTINMGYFGLGNQASGTVPANYTGPKGRYFEWIDSITNGYLQPRYTLSGPWSLSGALGYRYMAPSAYADSKLARDAESKNPDGSPVVRGLQPLSVTQLAIGTIYDTRDNEVFPKHGAFNQIAVAYQQGIPTSASVQYGEAQGLMQIYRPLGPLTFAARVVADFQFGHVPFYDMFESGAFGQTEAIGGSMAVRGVPVGRYSGEIKIWGNAELRAMFIHFHLLKQKVSLGASALFDTGRSWLNYSFSSPLDGNGVGLKYGVGGGIYCLWGQAAFFRIDAAYSPDALAENPSFPLGIYVADGTSF